MSYAFQSPRAQVSSSLPPTNYSHHDPYSAHPDDQAEYATRSGYSDTYDRDHVGDSYDENPARELHRDRHADNDEDDIYADTRAGAGENNLYNNHEDNNMISEKAHYGSPYAANRASGNSIWTKDDKRALASRSAPAKICRVLFGNIILAIILIVSIVCLIVMFLRPPNVAISGISVPSQNGVSYENGAFAFNVSVDISVSNPNSISASIKKLKATAYDSADQSTALGHGLLENQKIQPNANTTVVFPFQIKYDQSQDSDLSIIKNIASDCGLNLSGGSSNSSGDLSFLFKIEVDVKVLSVTVPVNINRNISFACPLSASSLESIISGLSSALTGSSRRSLDVKEDESLAAALVRRHLEKSTDRINIGSWMRDVSPMELVAAAADGYVRRYSPKLGANEGKRGIANGHDAL
ncbi:uncharacterized protein MEPE_02571 [Melanopsichium pennsylvanicum]|uniref:Late embryogenesis abundant protein LEA-2 subgroup domain-containing protein n=2 Tax=Melanopsichium pennsylvanicum TaxID=63383 RepID=A0AAJ5C4T7_9BASI|nr:conserved hypothetical protein [Melanopsichium pennsylvanicum 4]SNX83863.1 uncharacterized protein MEPE_02571 [Melanopsichium pennsylvanicum]